MKIYFDNNSGVRMHQEVARYVADLSLNYNLLNPSSVHFFGREAKYIIDDARGKIKEALGLEKYSRSYNVIFTSSGSEANNLVLNNFINSDINRTANDFDIFISSIEHLSILKNAQDAKNKYIIDVDSNGVISLDHLEELLSASVKNDSQGAPKQRKFISVMLANNETGAIQPIDEIVKIGRKFSAIIHTDAVCAFGKIPIDVEKLDVDFLTISGHKFGAGSLGAACIFMKSSLHLRPMIVGGGQEFGLRSGTENVIGIAAFGVASEILQKEISKRIEKMSNLRNMFESKLRVIIPDAIIFSSATNRLPNTSLIKVSNKESLKQIILLDADNICVSSGAACSSGKISPSYVLKAMSARDEDIKSAIRISNYYDNSEEEIELLLNSLNKIVQ